MASPANTVDDQRAQKTVINGLAPAMAPISEKTMIPLDSHVEVLAALRLGWSVFARVVGIDKDLVVYDARPDEWDYDWEVLVLEGWKSPETVWAVKGTAEAVKVDSGAIVTQERLF